MAKNQKSLSQAHKLSQFPATAICGNGILSSVLYVSGIAILFAGVYAPLILLVIAGILFLYKSVYTEVVEALPINGGAYNCLLNGTSKTFAAIAGVMTILSYTATAVISAKVGVTYFHSLVNIPVIPVTLGLLLLVAALVIAGIKDSSRVALIIFGTHISALILVLIFGLIYIATNQPDVFAHNIAQTQLLILDRGSLIPLLLLAFSASLLGISGFESSANFVEEQKRGVFRKTLRNMLIAVAIFNPLITLLVLNILPYETIVTAKDFLLADTAFVVGGQWLKTIIVIDAFMVLTGAVLGAFIGVSGLCYRLAADSCLPGYFTKLNARGTHSRIVLGFSFLCGSILILTQGELLSLAGVYTISFLCVMSLFALGNLILKETRTELKRTYHAPIIFVLIALCATVIGVIGNILINAQNLVYFSIYFAPTMLLVLAVVYQDYVLRVLIRATSFVALGRKKLEERFSDKIEGRFVVFIRNTHRLYRALDYINRNETGRNITLVYCKSSRKNKTGSIKKFKELEKTIPYLHKAGAFPHFTLDLKYIDKHFGPEAIEHVSKKFKIAKNRILIGSIHHRHEFEYDELGGVRIIF